MVFGIVLSIEISWVSVVAANILTFSLSHISSSFVTNNYFITVKAASTV